MGVRWDWSSSSSGSLAGIRFIWLVIMQCFGYEKNSIVSWMEWVNINKTKGYLLRGGLLMRRKGDGWRRGLNGCVCFLTRHWLDCMLRDCDGVDYMQRDGFDEIKMVIMLMRLIWWDGDNYGRYKKIAMGLSINSWTRCELKWQCQWIQWAFWIIGRDRV